MASSSSLSLSNNLSTSSRTFISNPSSTTVFHHLSPPHLLRLHSPPTGGPHFSTLRCSAAGSETGFFTKLGRLIKEKAKKDVEKIFSVDLRKREIIWRLLMSCCCIGICRIRIEFWMRLKRLALLVSDFGPKITIKIVESLRDDIYAGKLKSGTEIKDALKKSVLDILTTKGAKTELNLGFRKPAVIMIVGVNGGGKTTSLGKLAYRLKSEGASILLAAGDTFRAAASDQLEILGRKNRLRDFLSQAVKKGKEQGFDIVLCDTSGRLHTNYSLMEELIACKKAIAKIVNGAPNEILLVLDGTTGLNMLPQAREFNEVVGITGYILTKLDGSARGGCVVSVVDELGIPVKFVGVGEGVKDLQPFEAEAFVNAIFS
ncbi:putative signal recognition particle, SRP54 subunit, GTPase domain, AAA+ ATPase [Helianthus annuus]|nr:putative signal recognition particle, SRP54 subunit, GTPase domain, AAA+ ATPase [Helianthus annuus]